MSLVLRPVVGAERCGVEDREGVGSKRCWIQEALIRRGRGGYHIITLCKICSCIFHRDSKLSVIGLSSGITISDNDKQQRVSSQLMWHTCVSKLILLPPSCCGLSKVHFIWLSYRLSAVVIIYDVCIFHCLLWNSLLCVAWHILVY